MFFFCLCLMLANGVPGVDADEVTSVSVMEGDSVTLHTDVIEIHTQDHIVWVFGPQETLIADIDIYDSAKTFRDRLKVDSQTASLTITNITSTESGLYKLHTMSHIGMSNKIFNVIVYDHLPDPVITSHCLQNPPLLLSFTSKCVLLCSVLNVSHVSLSWYKGSSLLSSISVSGLNIRLSLPLEVDYEDTNTYTCVLNNPLAKESTPHFYVDEFCQACLELQYILLTAAGSVGLLLIVLLITCVCCCFYKKKSSRANRDQVTPFESELSLFSDKTGETSVDAS